MNQQSHTFLAKNAPAMIGADELSILVVDDDDVDAAFVEYCLAKSPLQICSTLRASTVQEARDIIKLHPLDLIVLDYQLIGGTALNVMSEVARLDYACPVLLVTATDITNIKQLEIHEQCYSLSKLDLTPEAINFVVGNIFHSM